MGLTDLWERYQRSPRHYERDPSMWKCKTEGVRKSTECPQMITLIHFGEHTRRVCMWGHSRLPTRARMWQPRAEVRCLCWCVQHAESPKWIVSRVYRKSTAHRSCEGIISTDTRYVQMYTVTYHVITGWKSVGIQVVVDKPVPTPPPKLQIGVSRTMIHIQLCHSCIKTPSQHHKARSLDVNTGQQAHW